LVNAIGMVPNIYQGLGNSPVALEGALHTDSLIKKGQLSGAEIEAVKLAVSEAYGCNYCLAAHTLLGKKAGLSEADTLAIRRGNVHQPRLAALVKFVNHALQPKARVSDADLAAIRNAGFNDAQIAEIVQTISQTVFTNLFNRVHQTALDFPPAPAL
ncbi:MAG: carboxymuconolactone decarboxylase family protein, partial [Burkholderiales bacterium]